MAVWPMWYSLLLGLQAPAFLGLTHTAWRWQPENHDASNMLLLYFESVSHGEFEGIQRKNRLVTFMDSLPYGLSCLPSPRSF